MFDVENLISCIVCGSYNVRATSISHSEGTAEFRCYDCGHYFVDDYEEGDPDDEQTAELG